MQAFWEVPELFGFLEHGDKESRTPGICRAKAALYHWAISPEFWAILDLNQRLLSYQDSALTTELIALNWNRIEELDFVKFWLLEPLMRLASPTAKWRLGVVRAKWAQLLGTSPTGLGPRAQRLTAPGWARSKGWARLLCPSGAKSRSPAFPLRGKRPSARPSGGKEGPLIALTDPERCQVPKANDKIYRFWVHVASQQDSHKTLGSRWSRKNWKHKKISFLDDGLAQAKGPCTTRRASCDERLARAQEWPQGTQNLGVGADFGLNKSEIIFWIDPP